MKSIINNHNVKILTKDNKNNERKCNCLNKSNCPMEGECLAENVVYEASLTSNEPNYKETKYIGISETPFKKRFANHQKSFKIEKYKHETELSKEVWEIKRRNYIPKVNWKIIKRCISYNRAIQKCNLCLNEKLEIILYKGNNLLNSRSELISKCRHLNKHTLLKFDSKD